MLSHWVALAAALFCPLLSNATLTAADKQKTAAERGWIALSEKTMNPGLWSSGRSTICGNNGASRRSRPTTTGPFVSAMDCTPPRSTITGCRSTCNWPPTLLGKGIVNNCLLCHAGTVAGQTVIGVGNAALDLQGLFEDLSSASGFRLRGPFQFSYARGTIDPINPFTYLMSMRDPDLNLRSPVPLPYSKDVCSDPPAWWLLKRKKTRDWTGAIDVRSTRIDMANLLSPFNSADHVKKHEPVFADIAAFLLTVQPPKYPFPVDGTKAARGQVLFAEHCQKCHGTKESYPNKVIALDKIGTDPILCQSQTAQLADHFNKSWLAKEVGPDGTLIQLTESIGYQAPPLDGIWATAPYFHNGSAPTVYHVLKSTMRPKYHTRSYRGARRITIRSCSV